MLKLVINNIPTYVIGIFALTISQTIINAYVNIYLIKYVIDAVQFSSSFRKTLVFILLAMLIFFIQKIFESAFNNIHAPRMIQKLNYKIQLLLLEKAKEIDIEKYDQPEFYNDFILSMSNADSKAIEVVNSFNVFIYNLVSVSIMTAMIASIYITGLAFVLINVIATYFLNIKTAKINYNKELELIPLRRKGDYVGRVFYLPEYAKEIRINNIKNVLLKDYVSSVDSKKRVIKKYSRLLTILNFINFGIFRTFLMRGVYLLILVYKLAVSKSISFGSFLALFNGSWEFKNNLEAIISIMPKFVENSLYIEKYRTFINNESIIKKVSGQNYLPQKPSRIEFRNVSFRYSANDEYVLKNVNLIIEPCEKLAIYGLNGTGKTTLIKLLMRLYLVTEGEILLDGKNINSYNLNDYYEYIGIVFQDFQLFSFTIVENVLLDKSTSNYEKLIINALETTNFSEKLDQTQEGINTIISKEFDKNGVNFSGGERQKIALARTMVKNFSIVIYDELASALDPISEYEINKAIWNSTKNRTVVCISHRINTNIKADRTIYIKEGCIVEDS